jgi:hypothetical protein
MNADMWYPTIDMLTNSLSFWLVATLQRLEFLEAKEAWDRVNNKMDAYSQGKLKLY